MNKVEKIKRYYTALKITRTIKSAIQFHKLRNLPPEELLEQRGDSIKEKLTKPSEHVVLICAFNEQDSLPLTLAGLAQSNIDVRVLVVNNDSTDLTVQRAEALGATVITEEKPGLIHALICGFRHLNMLDETPRNILHTDADTFPVSTWSENMITYANENLTPEQGGQVFAPLVFYGSLTRDSFRTAMVATLDGIFSQKGVPRPHGPNGIIVPDDKGNILAALSEPANPEPVTGTDNYIHHQVKKAGGEAAFNFTLASLVFASGDRFNSIVDMFKTFLQPEYRKIVYRDWHARQRNGKQYTGTANVHAFTSLFTNN